MRYLILYFNKFFIYLYREKEKMGFGSNEEWLRRVCGSRRRRSASFILPLVSDGNDGGRLSPGPGEAHW